VIRLTDRARFGNIMSRSSSSSSRTLRGYNATDKRAEVNSKEIDRSKPQTLRPLFPDDNPSTKASSSEPVITYQQIKRHSIPQDASLLQNNILGAPSNPTSSLIPAQTAARTSPSRHSPARQKTVENEQIETTQATVETKKRRLGMGRPAMGYSNKRFKVPGT
jgi:hypothetical protein